MADDTKFYREPLYVSASMPVYDCVRLMAMRKSRAVLVVDGISAERGVVGIFTESDLVKNFSYLNAETNRFLPVGKLMSAPVLALASEEPAALRQFMLGKKIGSVPILKSPGGLKADNILGIVHASDLLAGLEGAKATSQLDRQARLRVMLVSKNARYADYLRESLAEVCTLELAQFFEPDLDLILEQSIPGDGTTRCFLLVDLDHFKAEGLANFIGRLGITRPEFPVAFLFDEALSLSVVSSLMGEAGAGVKPVFLQKPVGPLIWEKMAQGIAVSAGLGG